MTMRMRTSIPALACMIAAVVPAAAAAQTRTTDGSRWIVPRTPDGHPDLQGNWTNATMTPIQRPPGQERVLTREQVVAIEGEREECIERATAVSDPDREAPPEGGVSTGCGALFDGAAGGTGGYNYFYIDAGDRVAIFDGEPRSSLVVQPLDGRIPPLTQAARQRMREATARNAQFGEYDNPENRPLSERCIMSFGSNAGPPMLPNYFYNNNYTIVQTPTHVVILTEMVHDVRIIRLGERKPLPDDIRPWMGDSWGWWEGDTLVVKTTNLPARQLNAQTWIYPAGSEHMTVTERLHRADEYTINYRFTVDDPDTYAAAWSGEVPFKAMPELLYEYACHEGNYALSNVLSGARAQERAEANQKNREQP